MIVRRDRAWSPYLHLCLAGEGGSGKTKAAVDFHKAGQNLCVVADYNYDMTLDVHGVECPIITPKNENDLRAIVEQPQHVIEKVIQPNGWEGYEVKTWFFDLFKDMQTILFGNPARKAIPVFEGAMDLEAREKEGILEFHDKPEIQHWGELDRKTRSLVKAIGKMPYHTIASFHVAEEYDAKTKLKLTGDPRKDKDVDKSSAMFINVLGDKIKHDMGYLFSDFLLYLESNGSRFTMFPKHGKGFKARTRMSEFLPAQLDWTGKSMYDIIWSKYQEAKKKSEGKS